MSTNQEELRKLDEQIAREIMKWPVEPCGLHNGDKEWLNNPANYPHAELTDDPPPYTGVLLWRDSGANGVYWSPSTSIEAAMEVVEKLRSVGVWSHIKIFRHTTQVFVEMGVPSSECQEWGSTAAEAICKCALKAYKKFEYLAEALKALDHTQGGDRQVAMNSRKEYYCDECGTAWGDACQSHA